MRLVKPTLFLLRVNCVQALTPAVQAENSYKPNRIANLSLSFTRASLATRDVDVNNKSWRSPLSDEKVTLLERNLQNPLAVLLPYRIWTAIEAGADVDERFSNDTTPIESLIANTSWTNEIISESLKLMLEAGADVNQRFSSGMTPIQLML